MGRLAKGVREPARYLAPSWLLFSVVSVCAGGKFYGHYFLQLLPALCVTASGEADRFFGWCSSSGKKALKGVLITLFIFWIVFPAAVAFAARLYSSEIYSAIGEEDPEAYRPIASYVAERTSADDRIFVWGFAAPIYTYSDRLPASRFLWCDWLTGRVSGTPSAKDPNYDTSRYVRPGNWERFFADMEKNRPVYFIDTAPGGYHDYGKYPVSKYPELVKFLRANYSLEATVSGADIYRRKD
jgi:hypothetical protein